MQSQPDRNPWIELLPIVSIVLCVALLTWVSVRPGRPYASDRQVDAISDRVCTRYAMRGVEQEWVGNMLLVTVTCDDHPPLAIALREREVLAP